MNEIKISIIVPVYKVEEYLSKCINSILKQTFDEFELILVDDGSPDRCGEICDNYAKQDKRIKVIHKNNEGLSAARNSGINIAKGKYIAFVDSDDYINERMYEILYSNALKYDSDITICKYKEVLEDSIIDKNIKLQLNKEILEFNNVQALNELYKEDTLQFTVAWNKLYKRNIFSDLRYDYGMIHEDEFIIHKLLYKSQKTIYIPVELYYYFQRENSIMKSNFNIKRLDIIYALNYRAKFFKEKGLQELEYKAQKIYIYYFFKFYYKVKNELIGYDIELDKIRAMFVNSIKYIIRNPKLSLKEKISCIIFVISPNLHEHIVI